jgi:hypothetical protein
VLECRLQSAVIIACDSCSQSGMYGDQLRGPQTASKKIVEARSHMTSLKVGTPSFAKWLVMVVSPVVHTFSTVVCGGRVEICPSTHTAFTLTVPTTLETLSCWPQFPTRPWSRSCLRTRTLSLQRK